MRCVTTAAAANSDDIKDEELLLLLLLLFTKIAIIVLDSIVEIRETNHICLVDFIQ